MKKIYYLFTVLILLLLIGCGSEENKDEQSKDSVLKETTGMTQDEIESQVQSAVVSKKYQIKSGSISFERTGVIGDQKIIVYFDDYGIKERSETYNADGTVAEIKFSDGETMYYLTNSHADEKIAYIMGSGKFGTEMKFEPDPFRNDEKRKEKYQFKKLPNIDILGRDCEAYSTTIKLGTTTFAGYDGLLLYTKAELSIGISVTKAVDIKENVDVDNSLFMVPEGYTTQKR